MATPTSSRGSNSPDSVVSSELTPKAAEARTEARAQTLRQQVDAMLVPLSPSSDDSRSSVHSSDGDNHSLSPINMEVCQESTTVGVSPFPPGHVGHYDNGTFSCGLFVHFRQWITAAKDTFGSRNESKAPQEPQPGLSPNFETVLVWVMQQLQLNEALRTANTVLVLSDTRELSEIEHWKYTSRFTLQRTQFTGPDKDVWFALMVPSSQFEYHCVWTAVYVLKALSLFLPLADLVLLDHDAAITTLFENSNLVTLAKRTHLPYRCKADEIGLITITEPYSPANAGIVWFPRLNPSHPAHSALVQQGKKNLSQLLTISLVEDEDVSKIFARNQFIKKLLLINRMRTSELCMRKQPPPMKTNQDP